MSGTFWSLVPAIVAIALALITKEVYSSLFIGVAIGAVFYTVGSAGGFTGFFTHIFSDGMIKQLSDSWNVGILVFLVVLGTMVALMNKAGGSRAFGDWAKTRIKSKVGAQLATVFLGILIFIDDYFNCLTVGSVMRPVTDKYNVSRAKLAYLIDSTAAPICIIAPISSWAAAVSGFVSEGENGIELFCKAIPFNFYALFTIIMMFVLALKKFEYGPMARHERAIGAAHGSGGAAGAIDSNGTHSSSPATPADAMEGTPAYTMHGQGSNGKVIDLVLPIALLILFCVLGMIYTGGFFSPTIETDGVAEANASYMNFVNAFADSDASIGLVLGSFAALILTIIFYAARKVLSFNNCMACIPDGFKAMVPAILILTLAWTLKAMTSSLGAEEYVAGVVEGSAQGLRNMLPAIIFVIACGLAFATGTSWGTFGILIPICIAIFPTGAPLRIISISACMAGAVCGDHISPISDTTIMASAGAQSDHVLHVSTQIPYALTVAAVSFFAYIVAGFTQNLGVIPSAIISWLVGLPLLLGTLLVVARKSKHP